VKVLLDECVPKRLLRDLAGHEVAHVSQVGLARLKNGRLLAAAQDRYDVLVTVDRNLSFQQNVPSFKIAVLLLHAASNRLADLRPLVAAILAALPGCQPGQVTHVGNP
jgi:predicted nuclease of predicted toxin-antitoxin system